MDVEVGADAPLVAAGLWVDGKPLYAVVDGPATDFVVHAERLQLGSGRHVGVVFARTDDSASAGGFLLSAEPDTAV